MVEDQGDVSLILRTYAEGIASSAWSPATRLAGRGRGVPACELCTEPTLGAGVAASGLGPMVEEPVHDAIPASGRGAIRGVVRRVGRRGLGSRFAPAR